MWQKTMKLKLLNKNDTICKQIHIEMREKILNGVNLYAKNNIIIQD